MIVNFVWVSILQRLPERAASFHKPEPARIALQQVSHWRIPSGFHIGRDSDLYFRRVVDTFNVIMQIVTTRNARPLLIRRFQTDSPESKACIARRERDSYAGCLLRRGLRSIVQCLFISLLVLAACTKQPEKMFRARLGPDVGIDFRNTIVTNDTFNALSFEYIYNGSGVAVGDFNNDGLEDLFFGGNQVSSRLYLNEGGLRFKDVTASSGVTTDRWVTGVSAIDINQDGLLDVFLAVAGRAGVDDTRDLLFINSGIKDGIPQFVESARAFGLDDDGYGTMGAFLDYDKDGDPDLYLVTNALESFNRNNLRPKRTHGEASSTDRLYRNNGDGTFTNVSRDAGIQIEGYGLGVAVCDLNMDSWPDIYVSNDFLSNDLVWINQRDGTFKNLAGDYFEHQTHNGMGIDIADFNNDARSDIMVVDMLPPGHRRMKMITPGQNYDHFHLALQMGYQPQYMRNTLQLNRGMFGDSTVRFSEIAFLAGVSSTDWSWAPLFADFDNDGFKDLFVANGYRKDVTDLDFIFFGLKGASPFGTAERRQQRFNAELDKLPPVKLSNYIFRNTGSLRFEDKTAEWGLDLPSFSNGAAYADLDNDGDLDIVVNNIDQEVIVYENNAMATRRSGEKDIHYLKLCNDDMATFHQKLWVYTPGGVQYFEATPYRGFQSTVSADIHVGLGQYDRVDSIRILWNDQTEYTWRDVRADTVLRYSKKMAAVAARSIPRVVSPVRFEQLNLLNYVHHEKSPSDIKMTRTLLHELSQNGPCIAVGDVNGDRLDDVFIGGEKGVRSRIFVQRSDGTFRETTVPLDTLREVGAAVFFDADGDGDLDLYVASSCAHSLEAARPHVLLLNDGHGAYRADERLPVITASSSCVVAGDYDGDGDEDLFIAANLEPARYPETPSSILLRNDAGRFTDVTPAALQKAGMISSAVWADINGDKRPDLVAAGEWTPLMIFVNEAAGFVDRTVEYGLDSTQGWWNCVRVADLNGDGFPDILAGNTGTNSFFRPTRGEPVKVIAKDFDGNGSVDPLITYFNPVERDRFLLHNRLVLIDQVPGFKRRFETFSKYATTPFSGAFRKEELDGAVERDVYTLASVMLINDHGRGFKIKELPELVQISTVNDFLVGDFNGDSFADVLAVGNSYTQETLFGQYDASLATVMLGDGRGNWEVLDNSDANLMMGGDVRQVRFLRTGGRAVVLVVRNEGEVGVYGMR